MKHKALDELVICTVKNIADFDFTSDMGYMFGGKGLSVLRPGETKQLPEPAAYRVAVNLAKAMLVRKCPSPEAEKGKGDDRSALGVWGEEDEAALVAKIITETSREEKTPELSETDRILAKIAELQKWKDEQEAGSKAPVSDKAEVIAELEKRGITFDRRQSKANLEKLLIPAE